MQNTLNFSLKLIWAHGPPGLSRSSSKKIHEHCHGVKGTAVLAGSYPQGGRTAINNAHEQGTKQGPGKESIKAASKVGGIWGRTRAAVKYGQSAAGLCSPLLQQAAVLEGGGTAQGSPQPGFGEVWGSPLYTDTDAGGSCTTFRASSSHLPRHL